MRGKEESFLMTHEHTIKKNTPTRLSKSKQRAGERMTLCNDNKELFRRMIKKKVKQYIEKEQLLQPDDKILVALSGGADSVALLHLLRELGYTCEAAHCNFHLRGEESDRDEAFVRQLCQQLEVPLHVVHFRTEEEAARRRISIEMAARELRYAWFEELRLSREAQAVAVAHHRDDSVETLLLNLIRGTGLNGLRGIRPKNGHIIRPLLLLSRADLLQYLDDLKQPYMTDSTNLQDEFLRNKIRLHLLPFLQTLNPSIQSTLLQTAQHLDEAYSIYQQGITEGKLRVCTPQGIRINALMNEPSPSTLLHEILSPKGFNSSQIKDIFHSLGQQSGKVFHASDYRLVKDRELLILEKVKNVLPPELQYETQDYTSSFLIPRERHTACLDADKLTHPLTLRRYQAGDSFVPFGMKGRKKVSDYLTDRKFSLFQKEQQWVLCCGKDIIWLVGERIDNRFRIDQNTQKVLIIKIIS